MIVKQSRLLFIDSEINTVGQRGKCRVLIPNHPFSVVGSEKMRLTLLSFDMRRQWYNVNQTNNEFYLYSASTNAYFPVVLQPGVYRSFAAGAHTAGPKGLGHALQDALDIAVTAMNATLTSTIAVQSVTFDENKRSFTFTLSGGGIPADLQAVCFQCKQGLQPAGVSDAGFFSDVHEIIGGIPTRDSSVVQAALDKDGNAFSSSMPASLNSLEAIYLRCNVQTSNYQTHGFEKGMPDRNGMAETSIFARIPLTRACFDDVFEFVQFEDANDLFQIHLHQKTLDSLIFEVTDDKGRLLAEVDPRQADLGLMNFKCVLRWDALGPDEHFAREAVGSYNHLPLIK